MRYEIRLPVFVLCFVQGTSLALINQHIFPFIAAYLLHIGVDPTEVSAKAGLSESLEALAELATLPIHVWAMNRYSHRWLSALSLVACGTIAAVFGLCSSVWQIYALRILTGFFAYSEVLTIIVLGEITDSESQTQAFAFFAGGAALGSTGGAALGGYLAEPQGRVPIFGNIPLFQQYPYILPGMIMAILGVIASLAVLLVVPETNARLLKNQSTVESTEPVQGESQLTWKTLGRSPIFNQLILVNLGKRICYFGGVALLTSAGKLPASIGGLNLEVWEIGQIFLITAMLDALDAMFCFKTISRYLSFRSITRVSAFGWIAIALFFPVGNYLATTSSSGQLPFGVRFLWFFGAVVGRMWWPTQNILVNTLYPDSQDRALAAGIVKQATNFGYVSGTIGYGYIFGISSRQDPGSWGRQTIWIFTGTLTLLTVILTFRLPDITEADPITLIKLTPESTCGDDESGVEHGVDERTALLTTS